MRKDNRLEATSPSNKRKPSTKVGVPEKGRNAGIALKRELPQDYSTDYLLDVLNGAGKLYAKKGLNRRYIERAVDKLDSVQLKDVDRNFRRPVLDEIDLEDKKLESVSSEPLESDYDRFYRGLDRLVEENLSPSQIEKDLYQEAEELANEERYTIKELFGDEVKWGAMGTDLEQPEEVLIPKEFSSIGKAAAERYWDNNSEYGLFSDYSNSKSEEEILAETGDEIAGIYMFVSGNTAEKNGLDYEAIPRFTSKLAVFESENQYKNSEEKDI